ncbi:bifunctional diaminohydroxyphosphoribosylaminopyrimidine deaminase/5-amino-6-(5-phosphoribosylamino)uracil reductase RibD [Nonomuraea sp. NPDC049695]|uniref:bifunctional diaminohydroxyphosphoribosylaminopyrimidine deaminase/5-amino-6-(5-phosphoribosylamino)uracil reductase RibD n=1 Tax=Nonomuraea sp. NPDC049695 TaxID=3154734 RepID=UPI003438A523
MEIPPQDAAHMARAVELAARGHGTTSPNPVVGCVVLDAAGLVVGEGFHAYAGGPHAEVVALAQAGERARGGTAYVTLEPCDHTGRTGPCSRALLSAGVARVVIAVADPNPKAAGGAARLRAHGVSVTTGVLAAEASLVNEEWLTYARLGRSHVTWKFAATLDGRSAAADGTSKWITSPEARADVHRLRAASDAIVAGIGTVLADDPHLTARPQAAAALPVSPAHAGDGARRAREGQPEEGGGHGSEGRGDGGAGLGSEGRGEGGAGLGSEGRGDGGAGRDAEGPVGDGAVAPAVAGRLGGRAVGGGQDHLARGGRETAVGDGLLAPAERGAGDGQGVAGAEGRQGAGDGGGTGLEAGVRAGARGQGASDEYGAGLEVGAGGGVEGVGGRARGGQKANGRGPLRVVVDTRARTPRDARVLDGSAPTLVAVAEDADTDLKADLLRLPRQGRGLDLDALLRELAAREIVSVFLEGGPTLAGEFLRRGLVDRVVAYVAPALLGSGRAALGAAGVGTIGEIHRLTFDEISLIGPDVRLIARPAAPNQAGSSDVHRNH